MATRRINHPSEVVSVNDVVKVYVYEIDEVKSRVQLSLLPIEQLLQREADRKAFKDRKKLENRDGQKRINN